MSTTPTTTQADAALDRKAFGRERLRGSLQQLLAFASLLVILVFFSLANEHFFTPSNLIGILVAATQVGQPQ